MERRKFDKARSKKRLIANVLSNIYLGRIQEFRQYTNELEAKFGADRNRLENTYNRVIEGLDEDHRDEIGDMFYDELHFIEEVLIAQYRKSTLVSLYSLLENSLANLCKKIHILRKYPDPPKGNGIDSSKRYLKEYTKIDFSDLDSEWKHLNDLKKIRDCIVHCEGNINLSRDYEQLQSIIKRRPDILLKNEREINIRHDYIDFILSQTYLFINKVIKRLFSK